MPTSGINCAQHAGSWVFSVLRGEHLPAAPGDVAEAEASRVFDADPSCTTASILRQHAGYFIWLPQDRLLQVCALPLVVSSAGGVAYLISMLLQSLQPRVGKHALCKQCLTSMCYTRCYLCRYVRTDAHRAWRSHGGTKACTRHSKYRT